MNIHINTNKGSVSLVQHCSETNYLSSVQSSHSVMSNSLWPHGLQHARAPCPSPTPGAYSNSCPLTWWCHPTISSSVIPFSSHLQSFPASGSFQISQFFASGGQSIGVSASASVLPMNIQDWFSLELFVGSLCSPRDSQESSPIPQFKSINSLALSFLYSPTLTSIHDYWKKTLALTRWTSVDKVMSLLFNMRFRLVITFLPRSKHLLISWLQSPSAMILEPKKKKSLTVSIVSPSICHEVMGSDTMIFFECWVLNQHFYSPVSPRGSLVLLHFLPLIFQ